MLLSTSTTIKPTVVAYIAISRTRNNICPARRIINLRFWKCLDWIWMGLECIINGIIGFSAGKFAVFCCCFFLLCFFFVLVSFVCRFVRLFIWFRLAESVWSSGGWIGGNVLNAFFRLFILICNVDHWFSIKLSTERNEILCEKSNKQQQQRRRPCRPRHDHDDEMLWDSVRNENLITLKCILLLALPFGSFCCYIGVWLLCGADGILPMKIRILNYRVNCASIDD